MRMFKLLRVTKVVVICLSLFLTQSIVYGREIHKFADCTPWIQKIDTKEIQCYNCTTNGDEKNYCFDVDVSPSTNWWKKLVAVGAGYYAGQKFVEKFLYRSIFDTFNILNVTINNNLVRRQRLELGISVSVAVVSFFIL